MSTNSTPMEALRNSVVFRGLSDQELQYSKDDQKQRETIPNLADDLCGAGHIIPAIPKKRSQDAATVEGKSRNHVENCQDDVCPGQGGRDPGCRHSG